MSRIGVFGGTFDPVHYGHIWLARQAADELSLDKLIVVPAKNQPFKLDRRITPGYHRYNMLKIAFAHDDVISISDLELNKDDISYTVDTLREIRGQRNGDDEIFFILGADAFLKIEKWKGAEELLRDYSFAAGVRPGIIKRELDELISRLEALYGTKTVIINNRQTEASSTEVKSVIKSGKAPGVLPEDVGRYIEANGLYQGIY